MKQVRLCLWSLVDPTPQVESVCQQLLTKATANENHTWNLTLKIKILKKMWYTSRKFCTLTLLSFLNSSQTTKSPNLFWDLEPRIEVWKLQTNYVTKHFFVKIKEHFLQQFLKVTARHSRFQGTDIEHREHMGLKHASREKNVLW